MILNEGEIITLDSNEKDYIVVKNIIYNNINYYYLMTTKKPTEIAIVKLAKNQNGQDIIVTVTDKQELDIIMKLTANTNN